MFNGLFNWNYILGVEDELKFSSEVSVIFADERLHVYKTWAMVVEAQDSGREDQRDLHTNPDHPQPRAEVTPPEKLRPPGWGRWDKLLYEYKKITRILKAVQAPPAYKGRGASGPSRGGAAIFGTAPGARLNTIKVRADWPQWATRGSSLSPLNIHFRNNFFTKVFRLNRGNNF